MSRGPGTNEEQIKKLRENLSEAEVNNAEAIIEGINPDVIALAYKLTRTAAKKKLPKTVNDLIEKLPEEQAAEVRGQLMEVCG